MAKKLTSTKAKEILHDKSVHGNPLTDKQRRFFGAIAGGAKPYKAEEGGWLDKYEQGGMVLKQKTKDNYGKKANPNNPDVSLPPGFKGLAYNTKGRNYSPAWGGQFQDGGNLTFLEPTSRKLPKGYAIPYNTPSTELATSIGGEGGEPAYLIPSFKYGRLLNDPKAEFRKTGEHLGGPFKTWQEADEWERTVRHPYVEKGQNIPTPLKRWGKDFAMGGSLPGAVGFTYARTAGAAPSNGPYAKKTKASAQNGQEMKYYQAGLDFKPKTISQDGSEIPNAQLGKHMLPIDVSKAAENFFELLSVPQKAITALFSGKYQTPSEAMGIKNKVGAIATDMILDPLNLMGAGAIAKASTETGILSKAYKYNPWAFKVNEDNWYRQVGKSAIDDISKTGLVREAGEEVSPRMWSEFQDQIKRLEGDDALSYEEKYKQQVLASRRPASPFFAKGELFYPMGRKETITKSGKLSKNPAAKGNADYLIETALPNESFQPAYAKGMSAGVPTTIGQTSILKPNPSLRDLENFNLYKQHWLQGYKKVKPPKKKEEGGEIKKDDSGYWNPENWGEPVEIGSNKITMQGVYEPLLGISDTGDTQMMYPGEDYTFDGESVTEYPVAKGGISVNNADAQPIEKLDQLLNFTNYNKPTKGGWLDKYN